MRILSSFLIVLAGALTFASVIVFRTDPMVAMLSFFTSLGLICVGLVDLLWGVKQFPTLREMQKKAEAFRENGQAIISIWIVCFLSLAVYSILWFTLGWATFSVIDSVTASYSFPAQAQLTITAMKLVLTWHPVLFFFGMLLWAYNLSQKTEEITQPVGIM